MVWVHQSEDRDTFHWTRLIKASSSLALNTFWDGAATTSLVCSSASSLSQSLSLRRNQSIRYICFMQLVGWQRCGNIDRISMLQPLPTLSDFPYVPHFNVRWQNFSHRLWTALQSSSSLGLPDVCCSFEQSAPVDPTWVNRWLTTGIMVLSPKQSFSCFSSLLKNNN